jgi:short-subunit dehydrogenase
MVAKFGGLITPEKAAKIAIRLMEHRVGFIIPGFINKLNWIFMKVVPIKIQLRMGYKISSREF